MLKTMLTVDNSGLITSFGQDGGDSCCRNYTYHLYNLINVFNGAGQASSVGMVASPEKTQQLLEQRPGEYVRNPNPSILTGAPMWYNNLHRTSRDQLTPVICFNTVRSFLGNAEARKAGNRLALSCIKRGGFAQNDVSSTSTSWQVPDLMTPDLWAIFLRGRGRKLTKLLVPVIAALDVFILLSTVLHLWCPSVSINAGKLSVSMPGPTETDDINTNNVLMAAQYTFDTPFTWLARKLFKRFRSSNIGNTQYGETNPIMGALVAYYEANGAPAMAEMARTIVAKY